MGHSSLIKQPSDDNHGRITKSETLNIYQVKRHHYKFFITVKPLSTALNQRPRIRCYRNTWRMKKPKILTHPLSGAQVGTREHRSRRMRITMTHDFSPLARAWGHNQRREGGGSHIKALKTGHRQLSDLEPSAKPFCIHLFPIITYKLNYSKLANSANHLEKMDVTFAFTITPATCTIQQFVSGSRRVTGYRALCTPQSLNILHC